MALDWIDPHSENRSQAGEPKCQLDENKLIVHILIQIQFLHCFHTVFLKERHIH